MKQISSGISSKSIQDDQSQLVLPKSLTVDDSKSSNKDLSKKLTNDVNRFGPALNKTTQNVPPNINQRQQPTTYQAQSTTQLNQAQSTSATGRIPARKTDVYDGNTGIDEWEDRMKAYVNCTNQGFVMDRVRVSLIKLFMA